MYVFQVETFYPYAVSIISIHLRVNMIKVSFPRRCLQPQLAFSPPCLSQKARKDRVKFQYFTPLAQQGVCSFVGPSPIKVIDVSELDTGLAGTWANRSLPSPMLLLSRFRIEPSEHGVRSGMKPSGIVPRMAWIRHHEAMIDYRRFTVTTLLRRLLGSVGRMKEEVKCRLCFCPRAA